MCHQTVSLAARHLEANGIPTIVMGCAKDIVEYCGVPRFLFSDFPLGNAAGRPNDPQSQAFTLELALRVLEAAPGPRTTVQSPLRWSADPAWKLDYSNIARLSPEEIRPPRRIRPAEGDRQDRPRRAREQRSDSPMTKPFAGIRILDFTRYVAGPFGTYQLALLGADVIKIEPNAGDDMRHSQLSKEWSERGLGPSFMALNANKRSLTLDLAKPKAVEIVRRLAKGADVVWENFRPGVMEKFGLGYEALSAINPRLIYCAVSGFGRTARSGDRRVRRQDAGDVRHHVDHRARGKGPDPRRLCAVRHDRRHDRRLRRGERAVSAGQTGKGQLVDVAMLDAALELSRPASRRIHGHRAHPPPIRQSVDHR